MALPLAFLLSALIAQYISQNILQHDFVDMTYENIKERGYLFFLMYGIALFVFYNRGHYRRRIPWWSQVRYVVITFSIIFLMDGFTHFAVKYDFSRLWMGMSWIFSIVFVLVGRQMARVMATFLKCWKVETIVVGDKENIIETVFALHSESHTGYEVSMLVIHKGYDTFDRLELPPAYHTISFIDGRKNYTSFINKHHHAFFVIAPDSFTHFDVEKIVNILQENHVGYAVVPPVEGIGLYSATPQYFFGHDIMFLLSRQRIFSPLAKLVKRLMDIVGSIMALLLLSPLFLILFFLVRKDGGPVFFGHKRVGKDGKLFKCWKFRTMKVNAEKELKMLLSKDAKAQEQWKTHRKLTDDPRITSIGKWLRELSIDEFPQFWNVLKGEMSLVGPRPIQKDELVYYASKKASYTSVKPGVTGLWQVSGRSEIGYKQRVHFDLWYIENWSLWHDIVILIKTVGVLIKRVGAR